ncbi:hypothetical protein ACIQUM_07515 [Amycolatopsis azurea]|uniref:hypothetical protein n=1 Tax=Amycolatopsis azurea TaxID=36819 RepID=UPI003824E6D2
MAGVLVVRAQQCPDRTDQDPRLAVDLRVRTGADVIGAETSGPVAVAEVVRIGSFLDGCLSGSCETFRQLTTRREVPTQAVVVPVTFSAALQCCGEMLALGDEGAYDVRSRRVVGQCLEIAAEQRWLRFVDIQRLVESYASVAEPRQELVDPIRRSSRTRQVVGVNVDSVGLIGVIDAVVGVLSHGCPSSWRPSGR